jgi:GGDEF domain-containing protein
MDYARFERWVIAGTALAVLISLATSAATGGLDVILVVGQLMLVVVMAVAVHWGRKLGTIAALSACLLYLIMRLPLVADGLSTSASLLLATRFAGYCLVGIVGGEVFSRVKYAFAGSESDVIDSWSRVYNQRYAARALEQAVARHERYGEPYSVVVLRIDFPDLEQMKVGRLRHTVRSIATYLCDDVRMVDDVARLDDGRFLVMLPHTPGSAAPIVAERLSSGLCQTLGLKREQVSATSVGAEQDGSALADLSTSLQPAAE